MAIQIGAKPDSGFDDPIGMLKDCHRRIERFVDLLHRVAQQAQGRALTAEEREAAESALRYFKQSGPRHNMDEEESLFPRMQNIATVRAAIDRLEKEHSEAAALHDETAQLYVKWIAHNSLSPEESVRLRAITQQLSHLYSEHIRIEEDHVFPEAAAHLDQDTLLALGSEFRHRRS